MIDKGPGSEFFVCLMFWVASKDTDRSATAQLLIRRSNPIIRNIAYKKCSSPKYLDLNQDEEQYLILLI